MLCHQALMHRPILNLFLQGLSLEAWRYNRNLPARVQRLRSAAKKTVLSKTHVPWRLLQVVRVLCQLCLGRFAPDEDIYDSIPQHLVAQ